MKACCGRWSSSSKPAATKSLSTTSPKSAAPGHRPSKSRSARPMPSLRLSSPKAMQSEMLEFEVETAHDQSAQTGKPILLPVRIGKEDVPDGVIGAIIRPLNQFTWEGPQDDPRLIAELLSAIAEPLKPRAAEVKLEPVGGAVPPGSPFYLRRAADHEFLQALEDTESILLIKGARQIGKTSMLARGDPAREEPPRAALP